MYNTDALANFKNALYVDNVYKAIQILRGREGQSKNRQVDLRTSELRVFSQNGEDGVINAILGALADSPEFYVEFGVGDGWSCNTRLLAEVFGWGGLYMEINDADYAVLSKRYRHSKNVICVHAAVTPQNVNDLFRANNVPQRFGVLSIDIDGQDFWIWEALDDVYQPDIVIIEFNSFLDPEARVVEQRDLPPKMPLTTTWGSSLGAMKTLGERKGYQLVHVEMAGVNAIFARSERLQEKNLMFAGLINRSPNYGLRGRNHPDDLLYGDGPREDRPQITVR